MKQISINRFGGLPPIVLEQVGENRYKVISEEIDWTDHFDKIMKESYVEKHSSKKK